MPRLTDQQIATVCAAADRVAQDFEGYDASVQERLSAAIADALGDQPELPPLQRKGP